MSDKIARNIYIEPEDWKKLKILAIEKNNTVAGLIRKMVDDFLIKEGKKQAGEELL